MEGWKLDPRLGAELLVVFGVAVSLWVWGTTLVGDARVDDAYITFAFSKNLALGKGPIYGFDLRVEGYSNFLWMILSSLGELIGTGALAAARFFSHGLFGVILLSTWLVARRWGGRVSAALCVWTLACAADFHRASQSGLETVGFAGLIAAGIAHYVFEDPERRRWSLAWFAGAALMRIDGIVPLGLFAGLEGVRWVFSNNRAPWRVMALWLSLGLVPVAIYWAWRWNYYGLPFPLTYYAKASMGIEAENQGIDYLWNGLRDTGGWMAVGIALLGVPEKRHRLAPLQILAFVFLFAGYVVHVGGDWMPFNRMLVSLYAPLMMVAAAGIGRVHRELGSLGRPAQGVSALAFSAGLFFLAQHLSEASVDTPQERGKLGLAAHMKAHTQGLVDALPFIQAMIRKPGDKLVTDYGGVFAYGTEASVIEMWGLANREIALRGNTDGVVAIYGKTCVPCYAEFNPDYFHSITPLLRDASAFPNKNALIAQIFQGRAIGRVLDFRRNFVMGRVLRPKTGQALWFLERKRAGVLFETRQVGEFVIDYPEPERRPRPKTRRPPPASPSSTAATGPGDAERRPQAPRK